MPKKKKIERKKEKNKQQNKTQPLFSIVISGVAEFHCALSFCVCVRVSERVCVGERIKKEKERKSGEKKNINSPEQRVRSTTIVFV